MTRRTNLQTAPVKQSNNTVLGVLLSLLGFAMLALAGCGDAAPVETPPEQAQPSTGVLPAPPPVVQATALKSETPSKDDDEAAKVYVLTPPKSTAATPKTEEKAPQPPIAKPVAKPVTKAAGLARSTPRNHGLTTYDVDGDFGVIASAIATGMDQRQPTGISDSFTTDTLKIWAFIKVRNKAEPTTVNMVWKKNGKKVWSYELRVGKSAGWRTWSRKTVRKSDAGKWTVEVRSARDELLQTMAFTITKAGDEVASR